MENLTEATNTFLPALNATLNGIAAVLLVVGYLLVRQKKITAHRNVMMAAFLVSSAFLASYLYYHFHYSSRPFQGTGLIRPIYFAMLLSHILLATAMVPFVLRMLWLALKNRIEAHRKLARWVWPVWMYTSVTGVLIYLMLYQWYPQK